MPEQWRIVRLQTSTVAALRSLGEDWQRMADHGRMGVPADQHGITVDWIVQELIRRVKRHRTRAMASQRGHVNKADPCAAG